MKNQENKIEKFEPAGKNDNFEIVAMDFDNIIEFDKKKIVAKNAKKLNGPSYTDLYEGVSIKAENGIINIGKYKAEKTKISQKEIG